MRRKILFCVPGPRSKELGGSKVLVELAEEMRLIGWNCDFVGPDDFPAQNDGLSVGGLFHENLREYLRVRAGEFDVVDYDHSYLPFPRNEFSRNSLFVARSVLLAHHFSTIRIPPPRSIKFLAGKLIKGRERKREREGQLWRAQKTVEEADIVNVSNYEDRAELAKHNIDVDKVVVIPYGISESRRCAFNEIASEAPRTPVVAFVGTFDYRKGAVDFPRILAEIVKAVPNVRFKLLGSQGLFRTEAAILAHFPRSQRDKIEIVMRYKSEDMPGLLCNCSVGIFPSYIEGMPFGILEMISASIPVIAYDAPGASMMLGPGSLVDPGDVKAMGRRAASLLRDREALLAARVRAKERAQVFTWRQSAKITSEIYEEQYEKMRSTSPDRRTEAISKEVSCSP